MYKTKEEIAYLQELYDKGELPPTRKEGLIVNPKVAIEITNDDVFKSIPLKEIESKQSTFGKINRFSKITPVDNLLWDFFFFTDVSHFRPAAIAFEESKGRMNGSRSKPRYTHHARGSTAWRNFWMEEGRRIIKGYEPIIDGKPCGIRIPGEFYLYLNYGWIKKIETDKKTGKVLSDKSGFPDFLAMDYYFQRELEAREKPEIYNLPEDYKKSLVCVKARRLGFSYKAGLGAVYQTAFDRNNMVIIASGTGGDAATCFAKSMEIIDHLTEHTPFGLEDIGLPANNGGWTHAKRSVKPTSGYFTFRINSTKAPDSTGRKSTIKTVSLHNEDDAIAGEGLARLYFEEAGTIPNLRPAWKFAEPAMKVGQMYRKGIAVLFGTGGEMVGSSGKEGSSAGLSNYFYKPSTGDLGSFKNIYDYGESQSECGLFFAAMWFYKAPPITVGGKEYLTIDENGNPFFWVGEIVLNIAREKLKKGGGSKKDYEDFLTQICKTPSEAFLITKGSTFQVEELVQRKTEIESSKGGYDMYRMAGELVEKETGVEFIAKYDLQPITPSNVHSGDKEGCLLRYVPPMKKKNKKTGKMEIPDDAYIISVDPIGINTSGGSSLVAIIVFNSGKYPELGEEGIVATYYGRPKISPMDYVNRLLMKLSKYYNAKITIENDRGMESIFNYFLKHNALSRLLPMPKLVTSMNIKNSKTLLREFGHSMSSEKHVSMGERYIYEWLDSRNHDSMLFDTENGEKVVKADITNLHRLKDEMLIHQLIEYDRNGNYDAVSAFMGIMLQMQEIYEMDKAMHSSKDSDYRTDGIRSIFNKLFNKDNKYR
jgi:hypothetical protein